MNLKRDKYVVFFFKCISAKRCSKIISCGQAHLAACRHNVWGIENIANLDKLPLKDFTLYNMVMKIEMGSAAPGRVFATLPGQEGDLHQQFHNEYCKMYHNKYSNHATSNVEASLRIAFYFVLAILATSTTMIPL